MYDIPEIREATDSWWAGLAAAFRAEGLSDVPDTLNRIDDVASLWGARDMLFSQTCGYPLTHAWAGRLQVIGTPCYDAPGCEGASYRSLILVREGANIHQLEDLAGKVVAFNGPDSLSGWLALKLVFATLDKQGDFFDRWDVSGAHLASMTAVRNGEADVCAIDAVTHALAARHQPDLTDSLVEIARSPEAPALPYVTRPDMPADDLQRMRTALTAAMTDPDLKDARQALFLSGVKIQGNKAYDAVLELERSLSSL